LGGDLKELSLGRGFEEISLIIKPFKAGENSRGKICGGRYVGFLSARRAPL